MIEKFEHHHNHKLRIADLKICVQAQRMLDPFRVKNVVANFVPGATHQVVVSERADGKYYIVDGQHCVRALEATYGKTALVDCRVHRGLSIADEAELFLLLNNQKATHSADKWRVGVTQGKGAAFQANLVLQNLGLKGGPGGIVATRALMSLQAAHGSAFLSEVLELCLLFKEDHDDDKRFAGVFIKGLARFMQKYRSKTTPKRLAQVFSQEKASEILHKASRMATKNTLTGIVIQLVELYDYRRPADVRLAQITA